MRPVRFLEYVRTYPDCEYRVQWDLGPEKTFRSLEAAVEYMQANCAGRAALTGGKGGDPVIFIYREKLPEKDYWSGGAGRDVYYRHMDGLTYGESLAYTDNAQFRRIHFSPGVDEVYQETFNIRYESFSSLDFNFDYGYLFGDYPEYEVGQSVATVYGGKRQQVYISGKFDKSRLNVVRAAASEDVRIGYLTEGSWFEETVPVATFSSGKW